MKQDNIEERISSAAKAFTEKIVVPEKETILSKEITRKRNPFILKKALLTALIAAVVLAASGITVAGMNGINIFDYFFGDPDFKGVQEKGMVTTVGMLAEKDGIKVELQAVFCDGDTTYLTIRAEGDPLLKNEPKRKSNDGTEYGNFLINRIKEVYISNEKNIDWKYSDKMYKKTDIGWSHHESSLKDNTTNGALLIFYASPKENTTVDIKIQFENETVVEFKQIELKVIPVQTRDLSNENYYVKFTGAVGHITQIKYSYFKTTIKVEWETMAMSKEEADQFQKDNFWGYVHQAYINGKEYYVGDYGLLPGSIGSRAKKYTENCDIIGTQATPQDTIEIRVYNINPGGSIGTLDYVLLTIPGEK